ncbi:MAG: 30S ribosomal protein S9 [Candidatus Margulisiibacteriota bacterium]
MTESQETKKTAKKPARKKIAAAAGETGASEKTTHFKKESKKDLRKKPLAVAVGRRKTSVARVFLYPGSGAIFINKRDYRQYVSSRQLLISSILEPLVIVNQLSSYDAEVLCRGGGVASQADAVKLGIARALCRIDAALKPQLSKAGCLARDPRAKERKKYGRKRARKRFQYTKR